MWCFYLNAFYSFSTWISGSSSCYNNVSLFIFHHFIDLTNKRKVFMQNLFKMFETTNIRVFNKLWILQSDRHKTHWTSFLYFLRYLFLLPTTQACYVSAIYSACVWWNKLGQQLNVFVVYSYIAQDASFRRGLVWVFHFHRHIVFL